MRSRGFTLLEVLVAMAIFAVIGLGANEMLRTIIQTHDRTQQAAGELTRLTRGFGRIQRDFMQIVPRTIRDEYGQALPPLMVATGPHLVELTRTGWSNPAGRPRSRLQRVAYDLVDGKVERRFWRVLDRAQDSEPLTQTVFEDVTDFRVNLLDEQGEKTDTWPTFYAEGATETKTQLPAAVEVIVTGKQEGEIRRVIPLVSMAEIAPPQLQNPGNNPGEGDISVEQVNQNGQ